MKNTKAKCIAHNGYFYFDGQKFVRASVDGIDGSHRMVEAYPVYESPEGFHSLGERTLLEMETPVIRANA